MSNKDFLAKLKAKANSKLTGEPMPEVFAEMETNVTHSNESFEYSLNLDLHLAAKYIMCKEFNSTDFIKLRTHLAGRGNILGYGSSRKVCKQLLNYCCFGFETNIELWIITQHIFYTYSYEEQVEICNIIRKYYDEVTYF